MAIKCQSRDGGVLYIRFYTHARSLALPLFKLKGLEQININTRGWSSLIMSRRKSSKPKGFEFFLFFLFYTAGNKTFRTWKLCIHLRYFPLIWFYTYLLHTPLYPSIYIYIFLPPFFPCFSMFSIHYPLSLSLFVSMAQTVLLSLSGAVRKWPRNRLLIQLSSLATRQGPPG